MKGIKLGVKFGEIDSSQILENEFRIMVLERTLDHMIQTNPMLAKDLNIDKIRNDVVENLQKKYPNSGIKYEQSK